jgi:hypothetical protein
MAARLIRAIPLRSLREPVFADIFDMVAECNNY